MPRFSPTFRVAAIVMLIATGLGVSFTTRPSNASPSVPTGVIPSAIVDRYLSVHPTLGDVTVVNVDGEPTQRKLLAASLQGIVNRTSARIYLVGARNTDQDQHWIDAYQAQGLVHVIAHDTLDQALASFASQTSGFVVASYAEPWTINTATSVAAATGGLVATPDEVSQLESLGLHEIANHVGKWTNASDAYSAIAATYRSKLKYQGMAIEQTDANNPRDFFIQQGIMTVYTRPSQPDYDQVMNLLTPYPTDHPVYGYVADNDTEEVQAIVRLSQEGRFLVPTDTTDNLSFHIAVGAAKPRQMLSPQTTPVARCTSDKVNVVIATSDGDNMVIPEAYLPSSDRWGSAQRGTLALGWGISPAAAMLMPAIWDSYARTATANDEIVGLVGLGYNAPSLMPQPAAFLSDSARLNRALGIDTPWSLDLLLSSPTATGWAQVAGANQSASYQPSGELLNYTDYGGPAGFTVGGISVLTARSTDYSAGASAIAAHISTLLATPADQRPLVSFFPSTVWNASYDSLVGALSAFKDQNVRFLTPREAFACLQDPTTTTSSTVTSTLPPTTLPPTTHPATTSPLSVAVSTSTIPSHSDTNVPTVVPTASAAAAITATPRYTG